MFSQIIGLLLFAIMVSQVGAGSTARMYGIGIFVNTLSAHLLFLASISRDRRLSLWVLYVLSVTAAIYIHYFSFFVLTAHGAWVLGRLKIWQGFSLDQRAARFAKDWILGMLMVFALYLPWTPSFLKQFQTVNEGWWVPEITATTLLKVGARWMTGINGPPDLVGYGVMIGLAGFVVFGFWRGRSEARFYFFQCVTPWIGVGALSLLGHASLLQLHYMVFAQAALLQFWQLTLAELQNGLMRSLLVFLLVFPSGWGAVEYFTKLPYGQPSIVKALTSLGVDYKSGDWILTDHTGYVNVILYYATDRGLPELEVKAHVSAFWKGHVVHLSTLNGKQIWWSDEELFDRAPARVWRVSGSAAWAQHRVGSRKQILFQTFRGAGNSETSIALYSND